MANQNNAKYGLIVSILMLIATVLGASAGIIYGAGQKTEVISTIQEDLCDLKEWQKDHRVVSGDILIKLAAMQANQTHIMASLERLERSVPAAPVTPVPQGRVK